ncbi:MAG: adenylyl-sulfate kinase [Acetobacteraceae bacterium]
MSSDLEARKILVMGLPGSGKTTLARVLAKRLNAVHFNADEIRHNINRDLGFSVEDRVEQARRMGWLCDQVVKTGGYVVSDFICPTPETREAFGPCFTVWVDRIESGRFEDTNRMFLPPERCDVRVTSEGAAEAWAERIVSRLRPTFDPKAATALFVGRYQPFHDGHRALIVEGIRRVGQACIAVRNTHGIDHKNPYNFEAVRERIEAALFDQVGRFIVVPLPNISNIFYGRDVGYSIERIELPEEFHNVSATKVRAALNSLGPN